MATKKIYLDYASTTPVDSKVAEVMSSCYGKIYGNAGSLHTAGRQAKEAMSKARKDVAKILNCKAEEIIFTGSGTESDNMAILGTARANKAFGSHVVVSSVEHHAVLYPAEQLEKEGLKVVFSKVDKDGILDLEFFKKLILDSTILVSIMYANNEIGTIQPIKEIAEIIKNIRLERIKKGVKTPIYFHTDACQAVGYLDLDVAKLGVDLLTLNGSKIYGPKGTGILYVKAGTKIDPIIFGGGQERGMRSGTENISGIVGLAEALNIASKKRKAESARETKLRDYFIKELFKNIDRIVLNGHSQKRLPNNINVSVLDIEGEAMLLWLDRYGIFVSTGSACDSRSLEPSHVILALGRSYEYANGALRFTLGRSTSKKDLDYVLKVFPKVVKELRKISPVKVQ
jgi:cysteine desulfurase